MSLFSTDPIIPCSSKFWPRASFYFRFHRFPRVRGSPPVFVRPPDPAIAPAKAVLQRLPAVLQRLPEDAAKARLLRAVCQIVSF
jgi:hypothetical protein